MIYRIASVYSRKLEKTDISFTDDWSIQASLRFLRLLIVPYKKSISHVLSIKFLPGNRFQLIQKLNKKFLDLLIRKIIVKAKPHILWIYNTEFYNIHNKSNSKILVLSCDKIYLKSRTPQMCYREQFKKGWVFAYLLDTIPKPLIFKNKSQTKIITELAKL